MKKLKLILSTLIVLALLSGLFVKELRQKNDFTQQEFLFDTLCSITTYSKSDRIAMENAFDQAAHLHRLADFYDDSSEVSKINKAKADEPITVDRDIFNILCLAQEICNKTNGAFDVSIAPVSRLWKFEGDNPAPPNAEQIKALLPLVNSNALVLDEKAHTVTKKHDLAQIDLGGIAKGYAADKAAELLMSQGVKSALIDFGGNIVALGKNPETENQKWRIGLQTPYAPTGEYSKIIEIESGAVVTSGSYQRYFEHNNTKYHHIIDPKTGVPAQQSFDSVTIVTTRAALADCLATAVFVMGEASGKELANEYNAEVYFLP